MFPFFNPFMMHDFVKKPARLPPQPPPPEPEPIPEPRPVNEVINPNGKPVRTGLGMVGGVAQNTGTANIPKPSSGSRDSIDAWLDSPVGQGAMGVLRGPAATGRPATPGKGETPAPMSHAFIGADMTMDLNSEGHWGSAANNFRQNNALAGRVPTEPYKYFDAAANTLVPYTGPISQQGSPGVQGDGDVIRRAQAMRQQAEKPVETVRTSPGVRQMMEQGDSPEPQQAPAMNDRRAQYMRNDFLRRMAVRHEDQLAKAGMGYEHLENEYDSGQGGHYDRAASMTQGLLNRLRTAREMDSSKRVKDRAQQDNMARRLGVHRAGVIFHNDLQNAQTPEDRIRVALSYHAMFPELGLGNMAAMMASQQGENENMQTAGEMQSREADAQRAFAAREADAQRAYSGQEGSEDRQLQLGMGLQQQAFGLQQQHNALGWQDSMTANTNDSNLAAARATAKAHERGLIGQGSGAARATAQSAQAQSPLAQMAQGQQMIAGAPVGQVVPSILADHAMRGGLPDPASQNQSTVTAGASRAAQVARQKTLSNQDRSFLAQYTRAVLNNQPASSAKYAEWAAALGFQAQDPRARQLWYSLTGINAGGAPGAVGDAVGNAMRGMTPFGAAGAMLNPGGAAAAAAARMAQ